MDAQERRRTVASAARVAEFKHTPVALVDPAPFQDCGKYSRIAGMVSGKMLQQPG